VVPGANQGYFPSPLAGEEPAPGLNRGAPLGVDEGGDLAIGNLVHLVNCHRNLNCHRNRGFGGYIQGPSFNLRNNLPVKAVVISSITK